jgi:hypothetical protein
MISATSTEPLIDVSEIPYRKTEPITITKLPASYSGLTNVVIMSAAFFFNFTSYSTLQSYLSTTLPANLGFESLVVIYVFFWLFIPIAPVFCARANDRHVMVLGALSYSLFTASLISGIRTAILVASAILGFGAALLWVAQGSFLTACSLEENRGRYAGIFWMGFQMSGIAGPLASYFILTRFNEDKSKGNLVMYVVFAISGCVATLLLCALRPISRSIGDSSTDSSPIPSKSQTQHSFSRELKESMKRIRKFGLHDRNMRLLLVGCAWTGLESAFSTGEFFKLIGDGKDESVISLVLIAFGVADSAG